MTIKTFQQFLLELCSYWTSYGCILSQPYDSYMGAGTFHPHTFLRGIGPEPWRSVYVQPCRRPVDGRYGKSPYRFQHYYQLQVLLKPAPANILDIYLKSLEFVGIHLKEHDICLLEDDWKGPTLGAWGLGWEVRANGQEVTQFTYFQQLGGLDVDIVCGEITYGLERLYMYKYGIKNGFDIPYNENFTYGDIFLQNEFEFSHFNFNEASVNDLFEAFQSYEQKVNELCQKKLILPAYDYVLQASHAFNLLDARGAISASERQRYIGRVRDCAKICAAQYKQEREKLGYPMLSRLDADPRKPIFPLNVHAPNNECAVREEKNIYHSVDDFSDKKNIDLVFEVGVEEMPPSFQVSALQELNEKKDKLLNFLKENFAFDKEFQKQLFHMETKFHVSSRRISLSISQAPLKEPTQKREYWGPAAKIALVTPSSLTPGHQIELTPAGLGFCRKNKIDTHQIIFKEKPDGSGLFLYFEEERQGTDFPTLFAQEFKIWVEELSAHLKMKWLEPGSPLFIRPIRWVLALAEDKVIPFSMYGLPSGRYTSGHRILHPELIAIAHCADYLKTLRQSYVEPSQDLREQEILQTACSLASSVGGVLLEDASLLKKCVGLSENPNVFLGAFDQKYLRLPSS
ncbi:MAG: glycine--tRNA ligase subunit alpha, partial [Silvanigrellaceae bacterium]|nr:glycine--tRNA ligase subunit alpha [Silvanigrellaceae bacterium]